MRILVVASSPADYAAWLAAQRAPAASPAGDAATRGEDIFRRSACGNCHAVRGLRFEGTSGPDLTHLASRSTLGAGADENTPARLAAWLRDPQAIKPGAHMPRFDLTDAQLEDLAAFLEGLL
jgi:cytochrome c oxidase subunit 2